MYRQTDDTKCASWLPYVHRTSYKDTHEFIICAKNSIRQLELANQMARIAFVNWERNDTFPQEQHIRAIYTRENLLHLIVY